MLVDPNKCVILHTSILEEKEDTLEEKKLKRLINLRDKCDEKKEFISKSELFSLVFETKEEEQVDRVTVNGAVINPTDASNKNYGLK